MTDRSRTPRPDPHGIARALEIDGQYVAHVAPQRAEVVALRLAARQAAELLGQRVRVSSSLPGEARPGLVTVVISVLRLDAGDEARLRERAGMLADELERRDRRPHSTPGVAAARPRTRHNGAVNSKAEPAIMDVRAGLGETKAALLAIGATAPQERSVAFQLDDHVLLLAYDEEEKSTTVAVGGPRAAETAHWLAAQLEGTGRRVGGVLPPRVHG